jgi:NADH-quinone oxidoreductase subunit N
VIDYHALAPELILAGTVMAVLIVDMLPVRKHWTAVIGLLGLFATVVPVLTLGFCESLDFCDYSGAREMFGGSYVIDTFSLALKGLFLGSAFVAVLLSVGYLESPPSSGPSSWRRAATW